MTAKLTDATILARLIKVVSDKEGSFTESDFQDSETPLKIRCKNGHEWVQYPKRIIKGGWCRQCWVEKYAGKHLKLKDGLSQAINLAKSRGGECLSEVYVATNQPMHWKCQNGHEWFALLCEIKRGSWCPNCSASVRERFCRSAIELLTGQSFSKSKPKWLLNSRGHRMELDGYCRELQLAFEHQGEQHFREVKHFNRRAETLALRVQDDIDKRKLCHENGVTLVEVPYSVPYESLLQWISHELSRIVPHIKINEVTSEVIGTYIPSNELLELHKLADKQGGSCLSPIYLGVLKNHRFRCAKGHEWIAAPTNIKRGTWCPDCKPERIGNSNRKHTVENMVKLAASKGGFFLSNSFESVNKRYRWRCNKGHEWENTPAQIIHGYWCRLCAAEKQKDTLDDVKALAHSRGGYCLSDEYHGSQIKLLWRCAEGHEWEARPDNVRNRGSWCPICSRKRKNSNIGVDHDAANPAA